MAVIQRSDDPLKDFDDWCDFLQEEARFLPECTICGEKIYQDTAVCIVGLTTYDIWICDRCLDELRQDTEKENYERDY